MHWHSIWIENCKKLKPLSEWGLHRLSSLQSFIMKDVYPELHSLPDECWLPSTLKSLSIRDMPNLSSLSKGINNLTSLHELSIGDCPNLRSLPDERTFSTLSSLRIWNCPLLERRCLKDKGADWHKIADIPDVVTS